MDTVLTSTLHQQYVLLDRLDVRLRYCMRAPECTTDNFQRQYGPYAREWDAWVQQACAIGVTITDTIEDLATEADYLYYVMEHLLEGQTKTDQETIDALSLSAYAKLRSFQVIMDIIEADITTLQDTKSRIQYAEMIDSLE